MYSLSLCVIARDENDYLPEWLDYHILIGVEHFFVYDNESKLSIRQTLQEYITAGWVTVLEISGQSMQLFAYDHCLQTFGDYSRWIGFIDADEFLVPKTATDLRLLLKDYEQYGGLAVSSLFFGTGGLQNKPVCGQIAAYRKRTHTSFPLNNAVKCIIQPASIALPDSPHGFTFQDNHFCVNENGFRVDDQLFPNHIEKIQLNHYFCRSKDEMEMKIERGSGADGLQYSRKRFIVTDQFSLVEDHTIILALQKIFTQEGYPDEQLGLFTSNGSDHLTQALHDLAMIKPLIPNQTPQPVEIVYRTQMTRHFDRLSKMKHSYAAHNYGETRRIIAEMLPDFPQKVILYTSLAAACFGEHDLVGAWRALAAAWQIAPGSYEVSRGLVDYFILAGDYFRAENALRVALVQGPNEIECLGKMALVLMRQGKPGQAAEIGFPVLLANQSIPQLTESLVVELLKGIGAYLDSIGDVVRLAKLRSMESINYAEKVGE